MDELGGFWRVDLVIGLAIEIARPDHQIVTSPDSRSLVNLYAAPELLVLVADEFDHLLIW